MTCLNTYTAAIQLLDDLGVETHISCDESCTHKVMVELTQRALDLAYECGVKDAALSQIRGARV